MAKIVKINRIPKSLSEQWLGNLGRVVYRLDNFDSSIKYVVIEQQSYYGVYKINFHRDKESYCDIVFTVKTDTDPTYNCQIGLLGGIEVLLEYFRSDKQFYSIFKLISDNAISKNLILLDIDNDEVDTVLDSGLKAWDQLPFTSYNDSNRTFLLIVKPK